MLDLWTNNFIQWNPNQNNQESDAAYASDTQRVNGAANPSIFSSATANKLFYQNSTMVTALGQMLANKGYSVSDANLANLVTSLSNIETLADFPASISQQGWQKLPSGLILQWGTNSALSPATYTLITFPITFPTALIMVNPFIFITATPGFSGPFSASVDYYAGYPTTSQFLFYYIAAVAITSGGYFAIGQMFDNYLLDHRNMFHYYLYIYLPAFPNYYNLDKDHLN